MSVSDGILTKLRIISLSDFERPSVHLLIRFFMACRTVSAGVLNKTRPCDVGKSKYLRTRTQKIRKNVGKQKIIAAYLTNCFEIS
ncbi:hypothetical protein AGMMS49975_16840 [Clostridia bacterium]|nr:hypothetical protein AGMMS49975_16840 [Clostridia bacterium]